MFARDSGDTLVALLTITGTGIASPIRLADNFTGRVSTGDDITYGLTSRSNTYLFLPFELSLPSEQSDQAPRAQLTLYDVTRYLTPSIRSISSAPSVLLELVLLSTPNTVEASFPGLLMSSIQYSADVITAELSVKALSVEPFPAHTFTPAYFPGLF